LIFGKDVENVSSVKSGIINELRSRLNYSMTDQTISNHNEFYAQLEAILFIAANPVAVSQLAELFNISQDEVNEGLNYLKLNYESQGRGLAIEIHAGRVQLTTAPQMARIIEKYLGLETGTHLSRAAVETLAIVAYRQPITRPGIDAIRGVSSDGVLRSLLTKGLVQEVGRAEGPGRPILYGTSDAFLQHFGLSSLEMLPAFELPREVIPGNGILKD
jgi:segregation and condensation protein B